MAVQAVDMLLDKIEKGDPGLCAPDFDAQPGPAGDLPFSDMMAERFFNLKSDRKTPFLAVFSLAAEVRVKRKWTAATPELHNNI